MNTVLEVGIQRGEPNRLQELLTACEHSDMEPSLHLYGALIKAASAWKRLSKCRDLGKELIEVGRDRGLKLLLQARADPEQATEGGFFPLLQAAQNGHDSGVELLLGPGLTRSRSSRRTATSPCSWRRKGATSTALSCSCRPGLTRSRSSRSAVSPAAGGVAGPRALR